ncbi:MAG: hypothetical protein SGJ20_21290 [Planctomycetota bacterium]|nr:hypothetical protein [Planctomycetota bacterium]
MPETVLGCLYLLIAASLDADRIGFTAEDTEQDAENDFLLLLANCSNVFSNL